MSSRRISIALTALVVGACAPSHPATAPAPSPASVAARELTADQQVMQALNRLTFGPRPGDAERVRAMGVDRWIDEQLHPERLPDSAATLVAARFPVLAKSGAELLRDYPPPGQLLARLRSSTMTAADSMRIRAAGRESYRVVGELQTAKVARAVASERQLQEVMTDFWENHFNVFAGKDRIRYHLPAYDATIRANALGKFRDLLGAVAHSDAMLQYLDNFQSIADSTHTTLRAAPRGGGLAPQQRLALQRRLARMTPEERQRALQLGAQLQQRRPRGLNENYARELMELHTLGVDGGYTQKDVIEVARALTGWSIKGPAQGGGFVFRPEAHDADAKVVLGHKLAAGRGVEDGEEVLDIVAHHPSTARFIAYKLARRFVSDTPSAALVARAAATFTRTDGDIRETLRTIVTSPEFFSQSAYRAKVKSPFELVVSAARALGAQVDTTPRTAQLIGRLGEPIFGHSDPNGYPETGDAWMNTGAILNRINFGLVVAANRLPGARLGEWPVAARLRGAPREQQVDGVVAALFGGAVSPDTRAVLVSGENPLLARAGSQAAIDSADTDTTAMTMTPAPVNDRRAERRAERLASDPAVAAREAIKPGAGRAQPAVIGQLPPLNGLAQIVGLALGAPEFQRR
ncbi:protein of unknown function DUF1800 [Gemmatirosa kalamazoonensis]|uniref:DUF1800 domain-containing protein n=1 Tax=Gemmatirosa kalamazoonensis TaxID=861299 RepID=W0RHT6_9BACT|nr:DUF1800 domain-containing protein [Gemmatirosa kalamazoonensis]AHG89890.1 protein of unknown function DUF1800 [Gemmatirosa kalamazoonensis]